MVALKTFVSQGLRSATLGDIPALSEFLAQLFALEDDFSVNADKQKKGLEMLLQDGDRALVLVAQEAGEILGMVSVQLNISTAEGGLSGLVEDLVVRADKRNQGWGTELLEAAIAWARSKKALRVQLLADKNNQDALAFYRRTGMDATALVCLKRSLGSS